MGLYQRKLHRLESVKHYLGGVVAGMYLPGREQNFINPVRPLTNPVRPTFLTMEVTPELEFVFSGAVAIRRRNQMVWRTVFSYDGSRPLSPRGDNGSIPAANLVLAYRAIDLLTALSGYGRRVSFNMAEDLEPAVFPKIVYKKWRIFGEDYTPVLGKEIDNPAFHLVGQDMPIRLPNPAEKILARLGVDFPLGLPPADLDDAVAALQSQMPAGVKLPWATATHALLFRHPWLEVEVPYSTALGLVPDQVVAAIRKQLPTFAREEATYSDLLAAANDPASGLYLSRLSRLQLFPVETLYDLPAGYAGSVLRQPETVSL